MMNTASLFLLVLLSSGFIIELFAEPQVEIPQGFLQGITLKSRSGRNFSSFIGIPYARPPVGQLRFSAPVPAEPWNGVYLANKEANSCPQQEDGKIIGNEDCLYLNVFTPVLKFNSSTVDGAINKALLPVMVWIHGGGFTQGSSGPNVLYGPNYLLDKDIVLVSINYRLGMLGFLTTGDSVAPGNFGLKDQVLALKWVQKNIRAFGGDPNRVTIFGESAGGASVHLLVLSNTTNGLFHQYISQSGNALGPWVYQNKTNFKSLVNGYGNKLGCPITNSQILVECLRDLTFDKLVNVTPDNILNFPILPWTATDESESEDAFLTDSPINLMKQGKLKDLPSMGGTVVDEGLLVTLTFYLNLTSESMEQVLEKSINSTSHYYLNGKTSNFRKKVKDFYFNKSVDRNMLLQNLTTFETDSGFFYPQMILFEKMAAISKSPSYFYSFGYLGNVTLPKEMDAKKNVGVPHGTELLFLFPSEISMHMSDSDLMISNLMVDLWTSFATIGKPTSNDLWRPYKKNRSFLQIGNLKNNTDPSVTQQKKYFTDRMNFWRDNFHIL